MGQAWRKKSCLDVKLTWNDLGHDCYKHGSVKKEFDLKTLHTTVELL